MKFALILGKTATSFLDILEHQSDNHHIDSYTNRLGSTLIHYPLNAPINPQNVIQ